jgi:hypothetical protein
MTTEELVEKACEMAVGARIDKYESFFGGGACTNEEKHKNFTLR